jgi:hypothetical protein
MTSGEFAVGASPAPVFIPARALALPDMIIGHVHMILGMTLDMFIGHVLMVLGNVLGMTPCPESDIEHFSRTALPELRASLV